MKPGTLVECVESISTSTILQLVLKGYRIMELPKKKTIYTVREIRKCREQNDNILLLEEMISGYTPDGVECGLGPEAYRELIVPPDLQAEITESLTRELVLINK